jgi:transposase
VLVLDGAGWHTDGDLPVPGDVTLVRPPPHAPQLDPTERAWLYLRERLLSRRLHADRAAVLDAACDAWRRLTPGRLRPLRAHPWVRKAAS